MNQLDPSGEEVTNVTKKYSRGDGETPPHESAQVRVTLAIDTSECDRNITEKEKCPGNVKLTLKYEFTISNPAKAEAKAESGMRFELSFGERKGKLKPAGGGVISGEIRLGTIECKGGKLESMEDKDPAKEKQVRRERNHVHRSLPTREPIRAAQLAG